MTRMLFFIGCLAIAAIFVLPSLTLGPAHSSAAGSSNFSNANAAINSAFTAARNAEQSGGNVTGLTAKLQISLSLVQKAEAENATNPAQATADLQNATQIANQVSASAPKIAQEGSSARQSLYEESIGSAIVIVALATLIYIYGARVYHLIWFYLYRNHSVRSAENG